jgi:hypothetical protein
MLPDPDTSYDTGPIIATIWQQFEEALTWARMVLVLGHSLHDRALVAALRTQVEPPSRLAVTVLPTVSVDWRLSVPKQVSRPGRREHLLVARSAHAVLAGRRPRAANRSPRPHGDPGAVEAAHKGRCHCCKGPELPRGLSAVVGPGCAGDDLGEHLAGALVVGGVQPQQRLAELERFGVLLEPPGADGQAV